MAVDVSGAAAAALRRSVLSATITERAPIPYDPYLGGRVVNLVSGTADDGFSGTVNWTAVIKRTEGPGLRAGMRELAAYQHGIAARTSPDSLSAPKLLAFEHDDSSVELWLEKLDDQHGGRWPVSRFGVAAAHIAAWDADTSRADPIDGFDSEDAWAERHGQPHRISEALATLRSLRCNPAAEDLMAILDDHAFKRTEAMITSTPTRIAQLAAFPQTLMHHDLVRSNLFATSGTETAAIDWENVGRGPFGVDLAPLVGGSVRRGEASSDDLPVLEKIVLAGYEDALTERGVAADTARAAYRLALGLRWHVVLGTIQAWLEPTVTRIRGSQPGEPRTEGLRQLATLSRHLLDSA